MSIAKAQRSGTGRWHQDHLQEGLHPLLFETYLSLHSSVTCLCEMLESHHGCPTRILSAFTSTSSQSCFCKPLQLSKGSSDPRERSGPATVQSEALMSLEAALNRHRRSRHKHLTPSGPQLGELWGVFSPSPTVLQEHRVSVVHSDYLLNKCTFFWLIFCFASLPFPYQSFLGSCFMYSYCTQIFMSGSASGPTKSGLTLQGINSIRINF